VEVTRRFSVVPERSAWVSRRGDDENASAVPHIFVILSEVEGA
jgi:hypothetical protein